MAGSASVKDFFVRRLVEDYAEKIFYFCLKKTGSSYDAEDLTSDILLNVITALEKGTVPEHFPAWVWRIARNRYSAWCDKKSRHSASVSGSDVGELEIEDKTVNLEEALMRDEQLRLLRRELSFISSEYRNIVVAYYVQNRKISDIALSLGLPEGTVTSKLYRARQTLKEGMNMARTFGKKSYYPEAISFCVSGNQPSGLPLSAVRRKIPVNILCEAHNNPCTMQELALELGIAVPYMEEEVELLVKAELLKKLDHGKYLTSFFIAPKECQSEINEIVCRFAKQHADTYWQLAEKALEKATELGVEAGDYNGDDSKMFFAFYLEQKTENAVFSDNLFSKYERTDGGNWGLIGLEQGSSCRLPSAVFGNNGNGWNGLCWDGYQALPGDAVFGKRRYSKDVPNVHLNVTLKEIAEGSHPAGFSEAERENLQRLIEGGFCIMRDDGTAYVNALVFKGDMKVQMDDYLETLPEYGSLLSDMKHFVDDAKEVIAQYSNQYLKDDFEYYVAMSVSQLRFTLSRLWKDRGLYAGEGAQFCAFYC